MSNLFASQEIIPNEDSCYLISLDSKNKIRIFYTHYEFNKDIDAYEISRYSGQYRGKQTWGPIITVERGKVTRNKLEQTVLQWNHLIKEKLDKGYKKVDVDPETLSEEKLKEIVGDYSTNQDGLLKPMLAKSETQITNRKIFEKDWYASRKINGVRTLVYYKDGELHTASRGGATNYDFVLEHILKHPKLVEYFKAYPNLILDSEAFKFGWTLNKISGICRTQKTAYDGDPLELYVYDILDVNKTFEERLQVIDKFSEDLNLSFNPERSWNEDDLKIQIVPHELISGWEYIKKLHDEYVSEGWEGLVIRDPEAKYKPGARGQQMIKVKEYKDSEYEIIGLSEGLREEDMCFVMVTPDGQQFNCKPIGDREQKQWYREHIDELIGKMATVKYFEMSGKEGSQIPQQPVMMAIRDYE
jgi:DNA ligase-1